MPAWNPLFLGAAGLKFYINVPSLTGFADGATVTTATGLVNGKNAVAAAGEEPTYETNEINGLPILRFDGVDNDMTITSHGLTKPCTVAFVAKQTGGSAAGRFVHSTNMLVTKGSGTWTMNGPTAITYGPTADANAHVHVLTFDGVSSRGSLDGTAVTGDSGAGVPSANMILASTGTANFSALDLLVVLGFAGTLIAENLARLEGYLAHYAGLQANLPGGHAYKSVPPLVTASGFAGVMS